jgi:hemerythrin
MGPLMEWGEQHSVGVERFDDDHRQVFAMLNDLHDAVEAGKGKAVLREVLLGLGAYTHQHFTVEEAVMRRTEYPGYEAHSAEHREFTGKLQDFMRAHEIGDTGVSLEVLAFLREWLQHHVLVTDRAYCEHLNAHGVR